MAKRYIPSWRELDILAKAGDMANEAYSRGYYSTAKRLDRLMERQRNGERVTDELDDLAIDTHNQIFPE